MAKGLPRAPPAMKGGPRPPAITLPGTSPTISMSSLSTTGAGRAAAASPPRWLAFDRFFNKLAVPEIKGWMKDDTSDHKNKALTGFSGGRFAFFQVLNDFKGFSPTRHFQIVRIFEVRILVFFFRIRIASSASSPLGSGSRRCGSNSAAFHGASRVLAVVDLAHEGDVVILLVHVRVEIVVVRRFLARLKKTKTQSNQIRIDTRWSRVSGLGFP